MGVVRYPQNGAAASYLEEPPSVASTRREDSLAAVIDFGFVRALVHRF